MNSSSGKDRVLVVTSNSLETNYDSFEEAVAAGSTSDLADIARSCDCQIVGSKILDYCYQRDSLVLELSCGGSLVISATKNGVNCEFRKGVELGKSSHDIVEELILRFTDETVPAPWCWGASIRNRMSDDIKLLSASESALFLYFETAAPLMFGYLYEVETGSVMLHFDEL